jgi:ribosomal protein S16
MTAKRVCMALMARDDKKYRVLYQVITNDLDSPRDGALARAKVFLVRMGTWKRNEFNLRNETAKF